MNAEQRKQFVEESYSSRFIEEDNGVLKYQHSGEEVTLLSIMVDFPMKNEKDMFPVVLKYGNFHDLVKRQQPYLDNSDVFNVKVIPIPLELYKWVDIVFDISASNWVYHLLEEIKIIEESRKFIS